MAIMTCPRCGGCGQVWVDPGYGGLSTSVAPYPIVCPSCHGAGYVTDNLNTSVNASVNIVLGDSGGGMNSDSSQPKLSATPVCAWGYSFPPCLLDIKLGYKHSHHSQVIHPQ